MNNNRRDRYRRGGYNDNYTTSRKDEDSVSFTGIFLNSTKNWWFWVFAGVQVLQLGLRTYTDWQRNKSMTSTSEEDVNRLFNNF